LTESAKLNGLNPQHYLADLLARIADHPARCITELLPWNWQPVDSTPRRRLSWPTQRVLTVRAGISCAARRLPERREGC
jgi:hypothetical protein